VKSRARVSEVRYNWLADGPGGTASYELEFPEGGDAQVVGNLIAQSATTDNPAIVSYGAEHGRWPANRLQLSHNTLINDGDKPGQFARVWFERLPADARVSTRNNLLLGPGSFVEAMPGDHRATRGCRRGFGLARPAARAGAIGRRHRAGARRGIPLPGRHPPLGSTQRWLPGAFQTPRPATLRRAEPPSGPAQGHVGADHLLGIPLEGRLGPAPSQCFISPPTNMKVSVASAAGVTPGRSRPRAAARA
jgi:hypothetical protein